MSERQIVLDTETTGLEVADGHRVIEIGCVEMHNRRLTGADFHHYLNPDRNIDAGAIDIHGITNEFLADKPGFETIAASLVDYLRGAELIIHNADFDVGFLDRELQRAGRKERVADLCTVVDTLAMARQLHPGQRVNLDALCRRYEVNNKLRELHGALLDARLLSEVYLAMTGGQSALLLERNEAPSREGGPRQSDLPEETGELRVVRASESERVAHRARLAQISKKATVMWTGDLDATEAK